MQLNYRLIHQSPSSLYFKFESGRTGFVDHQQAGNFSGRMFVEFLVWLGSMSHVFMFPISSNYFSDTHGIPFLTPTY